MRSTLLLQRSIIKRNQDPNDTPNLRARIPARQIIPNRPDGPLLKRSPPNPLLMHSPSLSRQFRHRRRSHIIRAIRKQGPRDVKRKRIDGVLLGGGLVARVGAQGEVEEVGEDEGQEPGCEGPEGGGGPECAGE